MKRRQACSHIAENGAGLCTGFASYPVATSLPSLLGYEDPFEKNCLKISKDPLHPRVWLPVSLDGERHMHSCPFPGCHFPPVLAPEMSCLQA